MKALACASISMSLLLAAVLVGCSAPPKGNFSTEGPLEMSGAAAGLRVVTLTAETDGRERAVGNIRARNGSEDAVAVVRSVALRNAQNAEVGELRLLRLESFDAEVGGTGSPVPPLPEMTAMSGPACCGTRASTPWVRTSLWVSTSISWSASSGRTPRGAASSTGSKSSTRRMATHTSPAGTPNTSLNWSTLRDASGSTATVENTSTTSIDRRLGHDRDPGCRLDVDDVLAVVRILSETGRERTARISAPAPSLI